MTLPPNYLQSTLLSLPDDQRAAVERELTGHARDAVLGTLAADVAHDIANPLFAIIGLVELLLTDIAPGSQVEERLLLIRQTGLGLKDSLRDLLDMARAETGGPPRADLVEATQKALRLVRRGRGKYMEVAERFPPEPVLVACPAPLVVQAALHLLTCARDAEQVEVEVRSDGTLRVTPPAPDGFGAIAAARIAADHGGSLDEGSLRLPLAEPESPSP
jgi:signal transduction histidine kinase